MITRRSIFGLPLALIAAPAAGWLSRPVTEPVGTVDWLPEVLEYAKTYEAIQAVPAPWHEALGRPFTREQVEHALELLQHYCGCKHEITDECACWPSLTSCRCVGLNPKT